MKKCVKCKQELEEGDFSKDRTRSGGLSSRCKSCDVQKQKEKRILLGGFLNALKSIGCQLCGEKEVCCIDIHHLSNKEFDISLICKNRPAIAKIVGELKKCSTVCANCHRKIHAGKLGELTNICFLDHLEKTSLVYFAKYQTGESDV